MKPNGKPERFRLEFPPTLEAALTTEAARLPGRTRVSYALELVRVGLGLTAPERRPPAPRERPDGSRVWRSHNLTAEAAWTFATAQRIALRLGTTLERLADLTPTGIPGSSDGPSVAGGRYNEDGSVSGPTPAIALRWGDDNDEVTASSRILIVALHRANDHLAAVERELARIASMPDDRARKLVERAETDAGAHCANPNCARWVECTPQDRLRAGRCQRCYKARQRSGEEWKPNREEAA